MRRTYLSDEEDVELRAPTEVKMLILGAPRVGKTSFITRLTQGYFTMFYNPTKLIEIHREVKVGDLNFTCWDIPATIRYHFKLTCLTADVVLLMFDSTRPNTKEMVITYWKKLYSQLKNIPYIFVVGVRMPKQREEGVFYIDNMSTVGYNDLLFNIQKTIR